MPTTPKGPTPTTARINREAADRYDLDDRQDFADADRRLIAQPHTLRRGPAGGIRRSLRSWTPCRPPGAAGKPRVAGAITLERDAAVPSDFRSMFGDFDLDFPIVTP